MLDIDTALDARWYYTVELRPGDFTKGFSFKNIAATRTALNAVSLPGASVLDISTMEGMFSILMARRGAVVTATDTNAMFGRVRLLQEVYGVDFDYLPHFPVTNFVDQIFSLQASRSFAASRPLRTSQTTPFGYDFVFSSGLIYHVLNPVDHLVNYRRMCKLGGLCLVESAMLLSDAIEMVHDWREDTKTFGGNATWFISTRAVEVFLKAAFFQPLGYVWVPSSPYGDRQLVRLAVVARAVDHRPFSDEETALIKGSELYKNFDFKPLYLSGQLTGTCETPPEVDMSALHDASDMRGSAIAKTAPVEYDESFLRLALEDR